MNYIIYHSILVFFLYFSPITLPVLSQLTVLILIFANNNLRSWLPKIHKLNILCTVHWSRPYLLAVSLPSPILACLRARPKPPCYAGYCWPSHHFLRKKKMGWVWGWVGVVFHLNPVITLGTGGFFLAWGRHFWFRPNSEDLHVGHCTRVWVLVEGRGSRVQSRGSRVTCRGSRVQSRGFLENKK